jgi:hypothetical protein
VAVAVRLLLLFFAATFFRKKTPLYTMLLLSVTIEYFQILFACFSTYTPYAVLIQLITVT